jgi:hypothetical protein
MLRKATKKAVSPTAIIKAKQNAIMRDQSNNHPMSTILNHLSEARKTRRESSYDTENSEITT